MPGSLSVYTIYHRPDDYPEAEFLVREHVVGPGGPHPGRILAVTDDLESARAAIPPQADTPFPRDPSDPPVVVESWL
jgi:hypothetical protein